MFFTKSSATVKSLCHPKGSKFKKLDFSSPWQRQYVWSAEKASLFIHTVLTNGFTYPLMVAEGETDSILIMDGIQRLSTCSKYLNNEFRLDVNTPDVVVGEEVFEVAKLYFKQLPASLQETMLDYSIDLVYAKNATQEELADQFYRLNLAEPITKITLIRALAGIEVATYLQKFEEKSFFADKVLVSSSAKKTHGLTETVMQTLSAFILRNANLSTKDLKAFALDMKENPLSDDITDSFLETIDYLEQIFPDVEIEEGEKPYTYDYLKKANIPIVTLGAKLALQNGVDPADAFEFFEKFFNGKLPQSQSFKSYSASGTSTKANLRKRFGFLLEAMQQNLEITDTSVCDFSVWEEMEKLELVAKEELKLQKAKEKAIRMAETQAKRKEKAILKAEKDAQKLAEKAEKESSPVVNESSAEVEENDGEFIPDEDTDTDDSVYNALTKATISDDDLDDALAFMESFIVKA